MMDKLDLRIKDYVRIESVSLPKAKKVTIRIVSKELLEVNNIKELFSFAL